jgi:hypothetical protein
MGSGTTVESFTPARNVDTDKASEKGGVSCPMPCSIHRSDPRNVVGYAFREVDFAQLSTIFV